MYACACVYICVCVCQRLAFETKKLKIIIKLIFESYSIYLKRKHSFIIYYSVVLVSINIFFYYAKPTNSPSIYIFSMIKGYS